MKLKTKIEVEVDPSSIEHDRYMIQALQIMYRDHFNELQMEDYHRLLEDRDDCKKRLKAIKTLLYYFMVREDFETFIESVRIGKDYTFNPDRYSDL